VSGTGNADGPAAGERSNGGHRSNGLESTSFIPLAEVDVALGAMLLSALGRAKIAAFLEPTADPARELLYAASSERVDARTIVTTVARANTANESAATSGREVFSAPDPLVGRDPEAEFRALTSDWHVDTVAAIRSAERDLSREDSDWRARINPLPPSEGEDEEHFVAPPPPPLPRLSAAAVGAILLIVFAILILSTGQLLGLGVRFTLLFGIGGILLGAWMLVMKLRPQPSDDDDDDGAIV
jgi:hypothetical protein